MRTNRILKMSVAGLAVVSTFVLGEVFGGNVTAEEKSPPAQAGQGSFCPYVQTGQGAVCPRAQFGGQGMVTGQSKGRMNGNGQMKGQSGLFAVPALSDYAGLDRATIESYMKQYGPGWTRMAIVIAKLADKPVDEILKAKDTNNTWLQVAEKYGVTREQIQQEHLKLRNAISPAGERKN